MMKHYNVSGEIDNKDNTRVFDIPELEVSHDIEAPEIPGDKFKILLKIEMINIRRKKT